MIDSLPEKRFELFWEKMDTKSFLDRNIVICDCGIKWIIDKPQSSHVYEIFVRISNKAFLTLLLKSFCAKKQK